MCHSFEMEQVRASTIPAQVIQLHPRSDLVSNAKPNDAVSSGAPSDTAVTVFGQSASEHDAVATSLEASDSKIKQRSHLPIVQTPAFGPTGIVIPNSKVPLSDQLESPVITPVAKPSLL